jgi:hypothetical protein
MLIVRMPQRHIIGHASSIANFDEVKADKNVAADQVWECRQHRLTLGLLLASLACEKQKQAVKKSGSDRLFPFFLLENWKQPV